MFRFFRCLVCLLLVCALIVNISPVKAKATSVATGVAVGVGIAVAVAAGLNALGVRQGSDSSSFSEIVSACADALSPSWAVDGLVTFLTLTNGGIGKTYASQNFLQAILDWLFANDVVVFSDGFGTSFHSTSCFGSGTFYADSPFSIGYFLYNSSYYFLIYSATAQYVSFDYDSGGSNSVPVNYGPYGGYYFYCGYSGSYNHPFSCHYFGDISSAISTSYTLELCRYVLENLVGGVSVPSTLQDLTLESVGQDVDTDYKTYVDTGIVDEDDIPYVPVTIPSLGTDTFVDQSQVEAQAGTTSQAIIDELIGTQAGTDVDTETGTTTGTATIADVITAIKAIPASIADFFADVVAAVQAIPAAIADVFTPAGEVESFTISLSDYFPFCIPFDLYDFLSCLNADPVAPVIDWEIPLPTGGTYAMQVDLSAWDDVAQLLRRLQLLLFCVGLAAKTRDLIKG